MDPARQDGLWGLVLSRDEDEEIRTAAAQVLVAWGSDGTATDLTAMAECNSETDAWRGVCLQLLGTLAARGNAQAETALWREAESSGPLLRGQALISLADLGFAKHWREEAPASYRKLVGLIRTALTHSRHEGLAVSALAAARVAEMRELAPEAEAIAANREGKPSLRAAAAQELAAIGRPESLPVLEACTGAQDPELKELRESAAFALKALRDRMGLGAKSR
jgi:hypothetical protein